MAAPAVPLTTASPARVAPGDVPAWAKLHLWHIQWVRDLIVIGVVVGIVYVGYVIRMVSIPLLLALALAYLFEPLVRWLRVRRYASRRAAAAGILVLLFVLVVLPITLGTGFAVVQIAETAADIAKDVASVQASVGKPHDEELRAQVPKGAWTKIRDFLAKSAVGAPQAAPAPGSPAAAATPGTPQSAAAPGPQAVAPPPAPAPAPAPVPAPAPATETTTSDPLSRLGSEAELRKLGGTAIDWLGQHMGEISAALGQRVATGTTGAVRGALSTLGTVGVLVFQLCLTAVFFYFMSVGWGRVLDFWERFIPDERRGRVVAIMKQMDDAIAAFVRGRVTICFILACVLTVLYWVAGVPSALVLGPVVGILFIIPYVHVIGVPIAIILMGLEKVHGPVFAPEMFAGSGGLWYIIGAPVAVYLVAQVLDDWVLSPLIQGKATDLAIPTIVFASLAGGALAGIYGLLIAIPVAACLRILTREVFFPRLRAWARGEAPDVLPLRQASDPPRV
jgi:predicted PurR-regulated permease PerM